jgi:DNA-binding MarR family transcriptional regulator
VKSETGQALASAVMATADAFLRESHRLFRPHGITGAQYNLLNVIAGADHGLSQREIGDLLVVDRSNITGLIDRMEKAGWVKRTDHPEDRRVYRVILTPAGRKLWENVTPRYAAVVAQLTRGLSEQKMNDAVAVLRHLENGAGTWTLPE